jgi:hypothetical protein
MLIVVDGTVRAHLARALAEHRRWLHRNGLTAPAELDALLEAVTVLNRPEPSKDALSTFDVEPVLMDMSTAATRLSVSRRTVERMTATADFPPLRSVVGA